MTVSLDKRTVKSVLQKGLVPTIELLKDGNMCPLRSWSGRWMGRVLHVAVKFWMFPVLVPTTTQGADGLLSDFGASINR